VCWRRRYGTTAAVDGRGRPVPALYGIPPASTSFSATRPIAVPVRTVTDKEVDQLLNGQPVDLNIDRTLRAVASYFRGRRGRSRPRPSSSIPATNGLASIFEWNSFARRASMVLLSGLTASRSPRRTCA
jgi:hypothetical protein